MGSHPLDESRDSDGRWSVSWASRRANDLLHPYWRDPDGKQRSRSFSRDRYNNKPYEAAKALADEIETDKRQGAYIDPARGRIRFREFFQDHLATFGPGSTTHRNYRRLATSTSCPASETWP